MVKKSGIYHHNLFVRGNMGSIARIRPTPLKKKKKSTPFTTISTATGPPPLRRSISFEREKSSNSSNNPEMWKSSSRNHDNDQHGHDYEYDHDPPEYNLFDNGSDAVSTDTSIVTEDGDFDLLDLWGIEDCECKCNGNGKCFVESLVLPED